VLVDALGIVVHHVKFATDDRLDFLLFTLFGKTERIIHISVIGNGNGVNPVFYAVIHQVVHLTRSVEQAVFGV